MKTKKIIAALMSIALFASVAAGCGNKTTTDDNGAKKVLDYYQADEPETLDAQQMTGQPDMFVANMFIEGLTRFGKEEGKYEPGVAKAWSYDEASNSYTFELRDDAKWTDGTAVTPADFVFGWRLAMDEQTQYSFMLSDYIKGAKDYTALTKQDFLVGKDAEFKALVEQKNNETDEDKQTELAGQIGERIDAMTDAEKEEFSNEKEELWAKTGVKVDGNKLTVELANPTPYFVGLTAFPVYFPVNEKFYNEHKQAGDYTLEAAGLNSNGPWVMKEWKHKDSFVLEKNENYWNKDNIKIDTINLKVVNDISTRTNLLKTGKLDGSAIQAEDLKVFQDKAVRDQYNLQDLVDRSDYAVFYVEFNHFNNKYTKNANIRKAIAYAMDRTSFVEKINIGDEPALAFIPGYFPGLNKSFREENGATLFEDNQKEKAKEYLAAGLKELGETELPPLDMLIGNSDISKKISEKFQEDWKEVGITINLVPVPWGEKLQRLKNGEFGLCSSGWGPDYMDPMTYLDLFKSDNGNNHGQYNNPEYDELIVKAMNEKNAEIRMGYLYDAEKILMDDMATAPQYFRIAHWVYKNYLTGVVNRGAGPSTDFYYADIDMEAKAADQE